MRFARFPLIILAVLPTLAYAICPLCTVAVGAGIGFSEWLGIDDTITGLWVGGFTASLVIWTIGWLNKKNIHFYGRKILVAFLFYFFTIWPLYQMKIVGHPLNRLWGMDKLILGIIIGTIAFAVGCISYAILKKHHGNKAYFPLQKVVMPVLPLVILSFVFYFVTR
jgi:nitrate reductase NapE component